MLSQQNLCVHQLTRLAVLYFVLPLVLRIIMLAESLSGVYIIVSGCQMDVVWLQVHTVVNSLSGMQ